MFFNKRPHRHVRMGARSASDRRPRMIITIVGCCASLILIILLTVLLGNHLRNRANDAQDTTTAPPQTPQSSLISSSTLPPQSFDPAAVPVLQAEYIKLSSAAGINWGEVATGLKQNGTGAVSLVLYYNEGTVNFRSTVSQTLGFQSIETTKTNLFEALGVLKVANIYSAGCFYVTFQNEDTESMRSIFREYEAALMAEAFDAGISDITLFGFGLDNSAAAAQLMSSFAQLDKYNAAVGIALPYSLFDATDPDGICAAYAGYCDYLALDLSTKDATSIRAALEHLAPVINKYSMRIIVPDTLEDADELMSECGINNWMKVPK